MKGKIIEGLKVLVENDIYSFSKNTDLTNLNVGDEIEIQIDCEYPASCDNNPFCEGDETCIICYYRNPVAFIKNLTF